MLKTAQHMQLSLCKHFSMKPLDGQWHSCFLINLRMGPPRSARRVSSSRFQRTSGLSPTVSAMYLSTSGSSIVEAFTTMKMSAFLAPWLRVSAQGHYHSHMSIPSLLLFCSPRERPAHEMSSTLQSPAFPKSGRKRSLPASVSGTLPKRLKPLKTLLLFSFKCPMVMPSAASRAALNLLQAGSTF